MKQAHFAMAEELSGILLCVKQRRFAMRHLITAGFIVLALLLYGIGLEQGSAIFFVLGAGFEIISAKRLRKRRYL
ncbi:hypothetical protein [Janthinobacterium sp. HLX7-2]|uniref:hypothetical protein n=1 Tax=Janthinobacterium sp. HLX7-2 TaxID=1259331 RepID=UPI003F29934A